MARAGWTGLLALFALGCGGSSTGGDGGAPDAALPGDGGGGDLAAPGRGASVVEYHNSPRRNGQYVDPAFTRQAAAGVHRDAAFDVAVMGQVKAQPLFLDGMGAGKDLLFVATEQNWVYAADTAGNVVWKKQLGAPVRLSDLPCGNIDPLGVTGAPYLDAAARVLYLDAMTTPDGGATKKHLVFALSVDDGSVKSGWPVDVDAKVNGFDSSLENERGALALVGGTLYVPYGGHYGDCGDYHGWVVAIPVANPQAPTAWSTAATGGGIWSTGGVVSDGKSLYVSTGNTAGANSWGGGEAVIRLGPGATFSNQPKDYFAPTNWIDLDNGDTDIGSATPVLVDVPGGTPSTVIFQQGKPPTAWLLDPANLGGIGGALSTTDGVAGGETVGMPATYTAPSGTFVVALGPCANGNGTLIGEKIAAASPPVASVAWCADQHGDGSPIVTTTDGKSNPIVWALGAARESGPGSNRLYAFDAESGQVLLDGGGAGDAAPGNVARFLPPIVAKGAIYVASTGHLSRYVP